MTVEQRAEEYIQGIEGDDCVILTDRAERKQAFIDGYHECQKEHEWHDLRKDPNDLPKPTTPVLVRLESGVPYVSWISSDKGWWFCTNYYTGEDKVIAWCELPTFDKE